MSKFSDVLSEAAYAIAGHGFAREFGSVEDRDGWNAIADVSPVLLRNVGEDELADRLEAEYGDRQRVVWINEDSQGFVGKVRAGTGGHPSELHTWERFEAAESEQ